MNFPNEERVFWVDRQSDRIVVGAKRLATLKMMTIAIVCFAYLWGDTFLIL